MTVTFPLGQLTGFFLSNSKTVQLAGFFGFTTKFQYSGPRGILVIISIRAFWVFCNVGRNQEINLVHMSGGTGILWVGFFLGCVYCVCSIMVWVVSGVGDGSHFLDHVPVIFLSKGLNHVIMVIRGNQRFVWWNIYKCESQIYSRRRKLWNGGLWLVDLDQEFQKRFWNKGKAACTTYTMTHEPLLLFYQKKKENKH